MPPFNYTYLIDLKVILDKNWNIFELNFQRISKRVRSKKEFLDKIDKLSKIRNKYAHPTRTPQSSEEDLNFLTVLTELIMSITETS